MDGIVVTLIANAFTLAGVIITVIATSSKSKTEMDMRIKEQQKEIEELKKDIKEHNNYAIHIPVIQTEIANIKESLKEIKNKLGA